PGDALRYAWIGEGGRADRDQRSARREILARVARGADPADADHGDRHLLAHAPRRQHADRQKGRPAHTAGAVAEAAVEHARDGVHQRHGVRPLVPLVNTDRKSTRLNSSHVSISYAVFCLKKKKKKKKNQKKINMNNKTPTT